MFVFLSLSFYYPPCKSECSEVEYPLRRGAKYNLSDNGDKSVRFNLCSFNVSPHQLQVINSNFVREDLGRWSHQQNNSGSSGTINQSGE